MLQNARVTAFTISELLRENQQGRKIMPPPHPPRLGLNFNKNCETGNDSLMQKDFVKVISIVYLMMRKGIYPNEYMNDWEKFNEASLPEIKKSFTVI